MRLDSPTADGVLRDLRMRTLLTPSLVLRRVRVTPQGVMLSLPLCRERSRMGLAIAQALAKADQP